MKKQPEQTAQTRRKLMDSFWKLFCDDGIDRVTVGAVTKCAGYNRGTFYEYFTDVYDLLDQLEDELLGELRAQCGGHRRGGASAQPARVLDAVRAAVRHAQRGGARAVRATRATHGSS